ncbi:phosphotransferase enzyme family protein [Streptomyces sp. NPDC001840]
MTTPRIDESLAVLREVTKTAGLSAANAEPIRLAENDLWRLPDSRVVVRIARAGQEDVAAREVALARWLAEHHIPAVRPLPLAQPIMTEGRAATFWEELPPHRPGTEAELAPLLRRLHDLPRPPFMEDMDPFVRISDRIDAARLLSHGDRAWLQARLEELRGAWAELPAGRPRCVIHGDAWGGNCAVIAEQGALLLDFERSSYGPPEWDLTSTAVAADSFGRISAAEYARFCAAYGYDVMEWTGYPTLRDIRELRLVSFAFQIADGDPSALEQAQHRIACVRGRRGPRPWGWIAVA